MTRKATMLNEKLAQFGLSVKRIAAFSDFMVLSCAYAFRNRLFCLIKRFLVKRNPLAYFREQTTVLVLCTLGNIQSVRIYAAATVTLLTTIANKRRVQELGASLLRLGEALLVHFRTLPNLAGNRCRIFSDSTRNRLEGHSMAQTFLDLDSILQREVLVLGLIFHLFWDLLSQTKCYSFFLLRLNATSNATVAFTLGIH